jgi:hypothetical protein
LTRILKIQFQSIYAIYSVLLQGNQFLRFGNILLVVIIQVIESVHPQSMSKEKNGARQSRIKSSGGDVPDGSHSHASNAAFGSKKKSGTLTEQSRGLLMAAVFLFMHTALTLLQETKSLLSATMSPEFDHNEASGVTDAFPDVLAPHPMIPSTNWKVGTLSGVDQAEMEVCTMLVGRTLDTARERGR